MFARRGEDAALVSIDGETVSVMRSAFILIPGRDTSVG
jgi:hypothetical protein